MPTTLFALLVQRCGLTLGDVVAWMNVRLDTAKAWSAGRNPTPPNVIANLRSLYADIERAAAEVLAEAARSSDDPVHLVIARNDAEARAMGWPCASAQRAAAALAAARLHRPVRLAPPDAPGAVTARGPHRD